MSPGSLDPYRSVDIAWELPSQPNGKLVSCTLQEVGVQNSNITLVPAPGSQLPTSHSLGNREPDTTYTFALFCSNSLDGMTVFVSGSTNSMEG